MKCRLIDQVIIKGSARSMGLYCLDLDYRSVQVADEKPLTIVWNSRNRFKARQFLESEKNSKLADDFNVAELFDTDPTLVCMRMRYTVEFFQLFNRAFRTILRVSGRLPGACFLARVPSSASKMGRAMRCCVSWRYRTDSRLPRVGRVSAKWTRSRLALTESLPSC